MKNKVSCPSNFINYKFRYIKERYIGKTIKHTHFYIRFDYIFISFSDQSTLFFKLLPVYFSALAFKSFPYYFLLIKSNLSFPTIPSLVIAHYEATTGMLTGAPLALFF